MIEILLPVIFASFMIAGIHTYFGLHILKRGIIFADLAIAQIVAMGSAFAVMLNWDLFFTSLSFGILGALLISTFRIYKDKIIQEALIGVTYVSATALTILFLEKAPHGEEALRSILSGSLLWITYGKLLKIFVIYTGISIIHFFFWKKFLALSEGNLTNFILDFVFFITFALTVTYAVQMGGVLLVFSFLIIPSLISGFLAFNFIKRLLIGWITGVAGSIIGTFISYILDIPMGPSIVVVLTLFLLIISMTHRRPGKLSNKEKIFTSDL